jgi:stress response protein YsnF
VAEAAGRRGKGRPPTAAAAKVEAAGATGVLPVVEEQVVVAKRRRVTGAVRVATRTREEERLVDEPYDVEEVEVQRVPVEGGGRWVDAPVPARREGDTTVVSVHEEVVVVETRLRVVEEVRLTRRRSTRRHAERVTVRRQEALVERLDPPGEGGSGGGEPG